MATFNPQPTPADAPSDDSSAAVRHRTHDGPDATTERRGDAYAGRDLEALAVLSRYRGWIVSRFAPYLAGAALEIGAGLGAISGRIRPLVDTLDLVEPSPRLAAEIGRRFAADSGVRVFAEPFETFARRDAPGSRDSIVMVNVLEHIENDALALRRIRDLLKPGGHLLLFVPALPVLFSKLDRTYGHFRRYTRRGLVDRVAEADLAVLRVRYFDLLGVVPWWLLNTLGGAVEFNPSLVRLYDAVGVPLTRAVESVFSPPTGKNLLLIARRPRGPRPG